MNKTTETSFCSRPAALFACGRQSIRLPVPVYIRSSASVVGSREKQGPLGELFDFAGEDDLFGCDTWEDAESSLQRDALHLALQKAGLHSTDIRYLFAGDLLGQSIATSFGLMQYERPLFGLYGACSTCGLSLTLASLAVSGSFADFAACVTSSHFASAEKEFRFPLGYGNQRPLSASWTVTGSGAFILANAPSGHDRAMITGLTPGKIVDYGLRDSMNMGACMAPAAADTIRQHFEDFGTAPKDYDKIVTGDLGKVGQRVLLAYSRKFGFEYGQSRAWGSFGYAIVALCAGFLFNINPLINFWVGSAFGLGMLLVYAFWVPAEQKEELKKETDPNAAPTNPSLKEMVAVLKMPTLWVLIVFMLLTNTFYTVFDQQMFPTYYANLFPTEEIGNATYGTLNGFQVFLESAMMGVVPIIMKKIGVRNALLLGATVMFLRIGLCGVFHDPITVSIVKLFHSIEVPLFCLPAFRYFTLHFDTKLSATLYMVGFQIASQVGQVIFSTPLGAFHDKMAQILPNNDMGSRVTFWVISAIVLCALIYGFFVIKHDDQEVGGDPFYTDKQLRQMEAAKA